MDLEVITIDWWSLLQVRSTGVQSKFGIGIAISQHDIFIGLDRVHRIFTSLRSGDFDQTPESSGFAPSKIREYLQGGMPLSESQSRC